MRYDNWKLVFMEQRCQGTLQVWAEPFTRLRLPKIFNLRTDPYEFADITSNTYYDWFLHNAYFIYAAQAGAAKFAETFKDFPPVQKPNSFTHRRRAGEDERVGGRRELICARVLERRRGEVGHRRTSSRASRGKAGRTSSGPPIASRSSTTTARSGASSRYQVQVFFLIDRVKAARRRRTRRSRSASRSRPCSSRIMQTLACPRQEGAQRSCSPRRTPA